MNSNKSVHSLYGGGCHDMDTRTTTDGHQTERQFGRSDHPPPHTSLRIPRVRCLVCTRKRLLAFFRFAGDGHLVSRTNRYWVDPVRREKET